MFMFMLPDRVYRFFKTVNFIFQYMRFQNYFTLKVQKYLYPLLVIFLLYSILFF